MLRKGERSPDAPKWTTREGKWEDADVGVETNAEKSRGLMTSLKCSTSQPERRQFGQQCSTASIQ